MRQPSLCACLALAALFTAPVLAQAVDYGNLIDVATGLNTPVGFAASPGDNTRLFIVEQGGKIRIINVTIDGSGNRTYALQAAPFLDLAALDAANPYFRDGSNVPLQDQTGTVIPREIRNGGNPVVSSGHNYAVSRFNEQGLLDICFAPDYATSGKFYIYYTMNNPAANGAITWNLSGNGTTSPYTAETTGRNALFEFQRDPANPALVLASSERLILTVPKPYTNHNGGHMAFGPDGYLYLTMGDGGSGGDPGDRALNPNNLLGKMVRLDVLSGVDDYPADPNRNFHVPSDNPYAAGGGDAAIWARGLRNPWRWSFDRWNGDLWIGDVGQGLWEEINHVADNGGPGLNYGWRLREGLTTYNVGTPSVPITSAYATDATPRVEPLYVFPHASNQSGTGGMWTGSQVGAAVVGGYVYRGSAIRGWRGKYIFSDTYGNNVWAFNANVAAGAGTPTAVGLETWSTILRTNLGAGTPTSISNIVGFGEDDAGEIFIVQIGGKVRKIVPQGAQPAIADIGQQGGTPGPDGFWDNNDFVVFIDWFFNNDPRADIGVQGGVYGADQHLDNNDFIIFIDKFFLGL